MSNDKKKTAPDIRIEEETEFFTREKTNTEFYTQTYLKEYRLTALLVLSPGLLTRPLSNYYKKYSPCHRKPGAVSTRTVNATKPLSNEYKSKHQ